MEAKMICCDCDTFLTSENTEEHKGFDARNYHWGRACGMDRQSFIKCDDCFNKAIDNYLENQYS